MPGEDPTTGSRLTAAHWQRMYSELLDLAETLALTDDAEWYRSRLTFWSEKAGPFGARKRVL